MCACHWRVTPGWQRESGEQLSTFINDSEAWPGAMLRVQEPWERGAELICSFGLDMTDLSDEQKASKSSWTRGNP